MGRGAEPQRGEMGSRVNLWLLLAIGLAVTGAFGVAGDALTNRNQSGKGRRDG
jgi:hypothetical protein